MAELKIDRSKILAARAGRARPKTTTLAESGLGANLPGYVRRLNLLIYGPPGTAKTVTAHGMPRTRTLDYDNGMQSVEWAIRKGILKKELSEIVFKTILPDPQNPKDFSPIDEGMDTVDEWLAEEDIPAEEWDRPYEQHWDTLIIDSGSSLTDYSILKALSENARLGISKSWGSLVGRIGVTPMRQQDWGSAASLFQKFINQCRSIGKNVVLICHEYTETTDEGTVVSVDPLLVGQLRQKIPKDFDEVWYAHVTGSRTDPKYMVQTTPDPKHHLRSRIGCLDPVENADFSKLRKKIAAFYGVPEDRLWVGAHGSEEREELFKQEEATSTAI